MIEALPERETPVGGTPGFPKRTIRGLGGCVIVLLRRTPTRARQFRLHVAIRMTFLRAYPDWRSARHAGCGLDRINAWLDENCGATGWVLKKAALEQPAFDAARRLFLPKGLGLGDLRTKPISMMGTERQQTVQSNVSGVQMLPEHLLVINRPQTSRPWVLLAREFGATTTDRWASSYHARVRPPSPTSAALLSPRWFAG